MAKKATTPHRLRRRLNRGLIDDIAKLAARGAHVATAARLVGVNETTLYDWLADGANATSGLTRTLWIAWQHAQATYELRLLDEWDAKVPDDWRAAKDLLERRFPEHWAPKTETRVTAELQVTQDTTLLNALLQRAGYQPLGDVIDVPALPEPPPALPEGEDAEGGP